MGVRWFLKCAVLFELSFAAFTRRRGHLFAVKACQQRFAEAAVLLHPCLDVQLLKRILRPHVFDTLPASNQLRAKAKRRIRRLMGCPSFAEVKI